VKLYEIGFGSSQIVIVVTASKKEDEREGRIRSHFRQASAT
jgi:hypothetical protein